MTEEVVGVVPHVLQSTGGIRSKQHTLIVTDQRLIVAQFTAQMMTEALAQSKAKGGKGLMRGLLAGRVLTPSDIVDYTEKYWSMTPESIVSESPGNFTLEIPGISAANVEHQVQGPRDEDSSIGFDRYVLTIHSIQGQHSFIFDADPQDMDALRHGLGERVTGQGRLRPLKPASRHVSKRATREIAAQHLSDETRLCTNCGHRVPYGANFYAECGTATT
jgi:hypothetical protein